MGNERNIKTEHTGAKNGGGFWGTRAEAKKMSKRARREADKTESSSDPVERSIQDKSGQRP